MTRYGVDETVDMLTELMGRAHLFAALLYSRMTYAKNYSVRPNLYYDSDEEDEEEIVAVVEVYLMPDEMYDLKWYIEAAQEYAQKLDLEIVGMFLDLEDRNNPKIIFEVRDVDDRIYVGYLYELQDDEI